MTKPYRLTHVPYGTWLRTPPRTLQRAKLDNLALVPANLLPYKAQWQEIANRLPQGSILICLPTTANPQRKALELVATHLKHEGYRVTTISAEQFV